MSAIILPDPKDLVLCSSFSLTVSTWWQRAQDRAGRGGGVLINLGYLR